MTKYFPKDYSNYEILNSFKKDKARSGRVIITNDKDKWFVEVLYYNLKDGKVTDSDTITIKDIPHWIKWFKTLNWNEV